MRALGVLLAALLGVTLLPGPASAAGERCTRSGGNERCASIAGSTAGTASINGTTEIVQLRRRTKVRVVFSSVQRRTDAGWVVTVRRTNAPDGTFHQGDANITGVVCADTAQGVYRTRGKVQWKQRGDDTVHSDVLTSRGVRKSRLC